jgi:hypothetical protein
MIKTPKKPKKKYICDDCSFATNNFKDFNRHNSTTKHKNATNATQMLHKKTHTKHKCGYCLKVLKHRPSLIRHLKVCKTRKTPLSNVSKMYPKCIQQKFVCECQKSYKFSSGLSKHKKKCTYLQDVEGSCEIMDVVPTNNVEHLLKGILQENKILREKISNLEVCNTINNTTNNTNNSNNNYTINMFLNEKCKNAMNLEDFVEKIKFTLEDLQYTADNGYANGISNVFIKNLNDMDVTERPIHCTDQKRLQFYVKNENVWEKDNIPLHTSIEQVSKKQIENINNWTTANPNYMDSGKKRDEYFKLVGQTMQSNDDKNMNNIKKIVGRNVKLDKCSL